MKEGSRRFQYQGASLLVRSFRYVVSGPGETRPMGRYAYDASPPNASISLKPQYTTRAVPVCGTSEYAVEDVFTPETESPDRQLPVYRLETWRRTRDGRIQQEGG